MTEGKSMTNEINLVLTTDEIERLLHEANNRACVFSCNSEEGENPWDSIRSKLRCALESDRQLS